MAAAAGAALVDVNPKQKPNPSASRPGLQSPTALADIRNTGRPNPPRSISVGDVIKENAKLGQLLARKTKIIEFCSIEINKLRYALLATRQQNLTLAQANSQITAELNQRKEQLKVLRHELVCVTSVLKLKGSGLERRSTTADNQLQKEVASQEEINSAASELAPVKTQHSVPCNTVLEEALQAKTNKRTSVNRRTSKRKSESCEGTKEANTVQPSYEPDMQPPGSSHHDDQRNTLRRMSSRLNPGSCEMSSSETLHVATVVPSSSSFARESVCRVASKRKLELCEAQKDSNIVEDITAKLHSTSTEPLHHEEMRKPLRRKSLRVNQGSCEVTECTLESAQEDSVTPLPPSSSKIFIEQSEIVKPEQATGKRSSVEVTGRRSSMRGAAKAVSYKEIPLNVKMRRP